MKYLGLVWANLTRRRMRTLFTALSIVVAFALFAVLMAVRSAFAYRVELAGADRLMMFHKVSFSIPLPLAHLAEIAATPGVAAVTHATWFGGIYQSPANTFIQFAVHPEAYLAMHPEYLVAPDQRRAWAANRTGCIVGRGLAERFGWKIGERVPLQGTGPWRKADGAAWTFTVEGIYDGASDSTDTSLMFFHYDYINDPTLPNRDTVTWYDIRVGDRGRAAEIADAVDWRFANSSHETKTSTETAFLQAYASQIGDVGTIIAAIVGTVLFTILLVVGNTMAQSIRERTNELAVLKTLGFDNGRVLTLVLMEALALAVPAGVLGMGLAWLVIQRGDPTGGLLPAFYLPVGDVVTGVAMTVGLGLTTGAVPAWQAGRLRIVDGLRRQG